MNNITAHLQVYKNKTAVEECIRRFRLHFPEINLVVHGDNGDNFEYLSTEYNFDYIHWNTNIPPIGFANGNWKSYLRRILKTCELYPNEWFLLMEEDVNTLHSNIIFPKEDFSGVPGQPFSFQFSQFIRELYPQKYYIKYNTCGASIIKMNALVTSINSVLNDEWDLAEISKLDNRISMYLDVMLSAILHLNGYTYGEWEQVSEISSNVFRDDPVFDHSWKEFYDYELYKDFRNNI